MSINYMDKNYYDIIQGNLSFQGDQKTRIKNDLEIGMMSSISYVGDSKRNGVTQRFVITQSNNSYKCHIVAFPNEHLAAGDIIEYLGKHWLVVDAQSNNAIQIEGTMWLCNHRFSFQNWTSTVIDEWGVFDNGSYTNDVSGNSQIQTQSGKANIYLPLNSSTEKIYVDKRLATGMCYDQLGNQILEVYKVVGVKGKSSNYGDSHLLTLDCQKDEYSPGDDSIDKMLCDYISGTVSNDNDLKCEIVGRPTIRLGGSRSYIAKFYDSFGNIATDVKPNWLLDGEYGCLNVESDKAMISVSKDKSIVGETLSLKLSDMDGHYAPVSMEIEVTA